jgi:hypothetical protein
VSSVGEEAVRLRSVADEIVCSDTTFRGEDHDSEADAIAAADRVVEHFRNAPRSLVLACIDVMLWMNAFADQSEKLGVFFARLVTRRVLSENDVLSRLKKNGKLAMWRKIANNADTLLQPAWLCLLPAHYSIIYQICLLIEDVGSERALAALAGRHDLSREDVITVRAQQSGNDDPSAPAAPADLEGSATQLFAVRLTALDARYFSQDYASADTLAKCLRRPDPADNAGLVVVAPIRFVGAIERAFMPLLGFGSPDSFFLQAARNQPEITDSEIILVARRGNYRHQPLLTFPSNDAGVLSLAENFFPDCRVKCQLFAEQPAEGWSTLIGDVNWFERPKL